MQQVLSAAWNQFMTSSCRWKVFALFTYVYLVHDIIREYIETTPFAILFFTLLCE
jgi:hypothetical protein